MAKFRINPFSALYHLIRNDVRRLEYDPKAQFEFHRRMSFFWIFNAIGAVSTYLFFGGIWAKLSVLYLVLVSLYANFATDYGAMPAAHGAIGIDDLNNKPRPFTNPNYNLDDVSNEPFDNELPQTSAKQTQTFDF